MILMSAFLLLAAPVAATKAPLSSYEPQTVANWLQAEGYRAAIDPNKEEKEPSVGPIIRSSEGGVSFNIFFYNCTRKTKCEDVQFYVGWNYGDEKQPSAQLINQWNAQKRFTKAYLDNDGDPTLEMDVLFTNGKLDEASWRENFDIFVDALGEFQQSLNQEKKAGTSPQRSAT
ncbi:YbjN domain-containing protein [Sphingomonas sp. LHG3443-2]|uniref:YbjN domain-containing protein n=1 Tax=Sphingomonas sp. LHG3443-2 TaxID=2804639 RepID=UPI003CEAE812